MNRIFFSLLTSIVLLVVLLSGCKKQQGNEKCLSYTKAPVTGINGPNTATVNQEINLTVAFTCFNGCGQFGNFEDITTGNTSLITVNAKYEGCICTQDVPTRKFTFKFKRSQPGNYDLKFLQTENTYLSHTVVVQ